MSADFKILAAAVLRDLFAGQQPRIQEQAFSGLYPGSYYSRERTYVSPAAGGDFDKVVTSHNHAVMLATSRLLYASNGNLAGAVHERGRLAVGNAWVPSFEGEDQKWGDKATEFLLSWRKIGNARGEAFDFHTDLRINSYALDRDGDILMVLTETADQFPLRQFFPAHRLGNGRHAKGFIEGDRKQDLPWKGLRIVNGIVFDQVRPVAVNLLGDEPALDRLISMRDAHLSYNPRFADQGRAIPGLSSGLAWWADLGDVHRFETIAVKLGSTQALVEYNESGEADGGQAWIQGGQPVAVADNGKPSGTVIEDLLGGVIRYFKAGSGSKLEFPTSNRPSPAWLGFMEYLERGGYESMDWPYDFVRASKAGGPTRLVSARAEKSVVERQGTLAKTVVRADTYALARAVKIGILPPAPVDWVNWSYSLPSSVITDAGHDGDKDREDYKLLLSSGRRIFAKRGEKWETEIRQIIWEEKMFLQWCEDEQVDPEDVRRRMSGGGSPPAPQVGEIKTTKKK